MTEGNNETSETTDGQVSGAPAEDVQLGDAGKRAIKALRDEVKELRTQIKAYESEAPQSDSAAAEDESSESTRDAASDVDDGERDAANVKPRFTGTVDQGARRSTSTQGQLTQVDLSGMSPRAIEAARRDGRLRDLLSGS